MLNGRSSTRDGVRYVVARLLLARTPAARAITILTGRGLSYAVARREVFRALADPYLTAGHQTMAYIASLESVLKLYSELDVKSAAATVPEVTRLDENTFLHDYYFRNRAVIVRGGASRWPAVKRWTVDVLAARHGRQQIQYMRGKRYAERSETITTTLEAFVASIRADNVSNDRYLVATNFAFKGALRELLCDCGSLPFLNELDTKDPHITRLWLGPAGTITPLHYDAKNVVFVQISGCKRFILAPAYECFRLDPGTGSVFSDVDPVAIDHNVHAAALAIPWAILDVRPGDILFIPIGWWHWVHALTESISINFADFPVNGSIDRWPIS